MTHGTALAAAFDPEQRFVRLLPGGNGIVYGVQSDGLLVWYRHTGWQDGMATWANGGIGRVIGSEWQQFRAVLTSDDGQLFGFLPDGRIRWFRYVVSDLSTGAGTWAGGGTGPVIGAGFDRFPRVLGGWDGVIFGIDDDGLLWWHHYVAQDGTTDASGWANGGAGSQVGTGWREIKRVWADPNGVIFGVRHGGEVRWWRYLASDGSFSWANGGTAIGIGTGWGEDAQKTAFSNGSGTVYAVVLDDDGLNGPDDKLYWYRLTNSETVAADGRAIWANGGDGVQVGAGFTVEASAALQGYADSLSIQAGNTLGVPVSTTFPSYSASVLRLAPAAAPVTVWGPSPISGRLQPLPAGYRANGCGWQPDLLLPIPASWQSGVYAARLEAPTGLRYDVVFVIRPVTATAAIAFVLPTNTYNAYNYWAGHNQYASETGRLQRTCTFLRPSTATVVDPPATISHTLYSDLFLLRWMSANSVAFDCYHDGDLHGAGAWLGSYKALIIASHSEYWSDAMRGNLEAYLGAGGRLICTGGNGIYERVQFTDDGSALVFRRPDGSRDTFFDQSPARPESDIIGANFDPNAWMTFGPYQVDDASHPFLAGTGLSNGDQFGAIAYDNAASGWEVNGPAVAGTLIAHGLNGAAMVHIDRGAGGWVFSTNSLAFNGALSSDPVAAKLLSNVLTAAVA